MPTRFHRLLKLIAIHTVTDIQKISIANRAEGFIAAGLLSAEITRMGGEGDAVYLSESLGVDKNGKAFNAIEPNRR